MRSDGATCHSAHSTLGAPPPSPRTPGEASGSSDCPRAGGGGGFFAGNAEEDPHPNPPPEYRNIFGERRNPRRTRGQACHAPPVPAAKTAPGSPPVGPALPAILRRGRRVRPAQPALGIRPPRCGAQTGVRLRNDRQRLTTLIEKVGYRERGGRNKGGRNEGGRNKGGRHKGADIKVTRTVICDLCALCPSASPP